MERMAKLLQKRSVVPAKAGTWRLCRRKNEALGPRLRGDDETMKARTFTPHLEIFSAVIPAKAGIHFDSAHFAIARRSENGFRLSPE
jgi:hypothetical protein